jgi:ABC-type Fe3+/spermidine/putrescine transport system ATPase subunit
MLQVKNISFGYQKELILKNINFNVTIGENIALIGESGCGKSTLLKIIYGLYDLDYGDILWKGTKILGPKFNLVPGMAFIKYVSQDFDLMPYITVSENIGKYLSNVNKEKKQKRILELLNVVEMTDYADIKAQFLSGGQQQRVALARALALEPEILLLDEPFSHIDNFRKNALRRNLFAYLKNKNVTCIVATHDSTDALSFADQTIVLQNGELIDKRNSMELYYNPVNKYSAYLLNKSRF